MSISLLLEQARGGLGAAIRAKEEGAKDVVLVERAEELGGILPNVFIMALVCTILGRSCQARLTPINLSRRLKIWCRSADPYHGYRPG